MNKIPFTQIILQSQTTEDFYPGIGTKPLKDIIFDKVTTFYDFLVPDAFAEDFDSVSNGSGPGGASGGGWGGISPDVGSGFSSGQNFVVRADPLTLDLDGDGIEIRALAQPGSGSTPVYFDYNQNGAKVNTAWIFPDDGMLVFDRNGNGTIDDGSELFSNYTPLNNGGTAYNGIYALAQEDTNKDGIVNNLDANWNNLQIWRDINSDGISQSEELFTLEQMGITGLATKATNYTYTYTKSDGTTGVMADVHSAVDTFHQQFTEAIPVSPDVEVLPDMQGAGLVRTLHEAASLSPELKDLLTQYSQATTRAEQMALLEQLLYKWADTSGLIATMEERYTGAVPFYNSYSGQEGAMLHILESFNGRYFFSLPGERNLEGASAVTGIEPLYIRRSYYDEQGRWHSYQELVGWRVPLIATQYNFLKSAYDKLRESVYESLFYQTRFQTVFIPLLDKIEFVVGENNQITWDYTQLRQYFTDAIAADAATGLSDLLEFNRYVANNFLPIDWEGNELFAEYVRNTPVTPELQAMYDSYQNYLHVLGANTTYYTASSANGEEIIAAGNTNTRILGNAGNDIIIGGSGNDSLYGQAGNDYLSGGGGNDVIYGGDGNDALIGGDGNDTLYGNAGDDILNGGAGNDVLYGGSGYNESWRGTAVSNGNDTYLFGRGSGQDEIYDCDKIAGNQDIIRLDADITPDDVSLRRNGNDLVLSINDTPAVLTVKNWFLEPDYYKIEYIQFADGTVWDVPVIKQHVLQGTAGDDVLLGYDTADTFNGKEGNDTLYGYAGDDTLDGGTGNDQLYGGAGNDTYLFGRGSGQDTIIDEDFTEGNLDAIVLASDITPDDVSLRHNGNDLVLSIKDTPDVLTVKDWFYKYSDKYQVERIQFADGTVWDVPAIKQQVLQGTSGNDVLLGYDTADTFNGKEGNDTLYGYAGDDTLDGGAGNDQLYGGAGNDTYLFGRGSGRDEIFDYDAIAGNQDVIRLDSGITPEDIILGRNGEDLIVVINDTGDSLTVKNWFLNESAEHQVGCILLASAPV
jgi:Ca2+-binding RTX toxin-like protein